MLWAVGSFAGLALLWQVVDVYFSFGSPAPAPSDSEILRYDLTALLCVGSVLAALLLSIVRRSVWLSVFSGVLVVVALGGAAVVSVPSGRWFVDEQTNHPLPSNYHPCYSGSRDCGHGG
jgi:hypothetical protein